MREVKRQLESYWFEIIEDLPAPSFKEAVTVGVDTGDLRPLQNRKLARRCSAWSTAAVAAVVVITMGAVAWLLGSDGEGASVIDEGPALTGAPPTSVARPSTLPEGLSYPPDPVTVTTPLGTMEWTFTDSVRLESDIVPWGDRFLALGNNGWAFPTLLVSADGIEWDRDASLPSQPPVREPVGVAVYDGSVYVAGRKTVMPEGYILTHPSVWVSSDLEEWRELTVEHVEGVYHRWHSIVATDTGLILYTGPGHIWALSDERFILSDLTLTSPRSLEYTEGPPIWAVEGGFVTRAAVAWSPGQHVFSTDGLRWEPIEAGDGDAAALVAVGRGPDGYLALSVLPPAILRSPDGIVWETLDTSGPPSLSDSNLTLESVVVAIEGGWLIAANDGWTSTASISANGTHWSELPSEMTETWWCGVPNTTDGRTIAVNGCFGNRGYSTWWTGQWIGRILND